ncbi:hypothetical protein [Luteolibacter soli]|uniref:Right handed beta helix domain-containing protein n=1 Tax=Luteolibacter soli TaxID=3135280 RepID=A0ABU9AUS6_9BACT
MKLPLSLLAGLSLAAHAAITVNGVADNSYYNDTATFTVVADPGFNFTAALDGTSVIVGSPVTTQAVGYHELEITRTPSAGGTTELLSLQFIIRASTRGSTESGLPAWTPHRIVEDASSAFAGATLDLITPSAWPKDLALPVVAKLSNPAGEVVRLNGRVSLGGSSGRQFWLRRGWGSRVLPPLTSAAIVELDGSAGGLSAEAPVTIEDTTSWTPVTGTLSGNQSWPANSRMHVTGTLTIAAGATLTIGAGSVIKLDPGVEIIANGTLDAQGTITAPVTFTPRSTTEPWGGIELNVATSRVQAAGTIFTGAGADPTWFSTHSGYASHRSEQALFLVAAAGAELHTNNVWMIDLHGQAMNSRAGAVIDLQRTLIQRCITGGELNGSTITIDRSAVIEIPADTPDFVDGDNDGLYFTSGTQTVSRSVIGWTKDDGIDSGGDGGAGTVTTLLDNWYESTFHEGHSLSGRRTVSYSGCVFTDCGQGVECGYGASAGGPLTLVENCAFVGNLNGARFGDNYDWTYNGSLEVRNSILTGNHYHDVWGYDWTSWTYNGPAKLNVHDNLIGMPDPLHHPANATWDPASHASSLGSFMPVPGSDVGIAITTPALPPDTGAYSGSFQVRLSTFSSRPVTATWTISGAMDDSSPLTPVLTGNVNFLPGETVKTIAAPMASPASYRKLVIALGSPQAAEVTGPDAWFLHTTPSPDPVIIAKGSSGWRVRSTPSEPPATWKNIGFDDSSPAATEWSPATLPAGFGSISGVTFATIVPSGPGSDRTRTFYFRKGFTVTDPAKVSSITLGIRRDDGVLAWLNGASQPVANSTDGAPLPVPSTYATLAPNATNTASYHSFQIPGTMLVPGTNTLALELHQSSTTSSDVMVDVELLVTYLKPLALQQGRVGNRHVLLWEATDATLEMSEDLETWQSLPDASGILEFSPVDPSRGFFRLRR